MSEIVTEIDNIPDAVASGLRMLTHSSTLLYSILAQPEVDAIEAKYNHPIRQAHEHLFIGAEAETRIEQLIDQAYDNFFLHLQSQCAAIIEDNENVTRYITEVQQHVTPRQGIHYRAEVLGTSVAQAKGITEDKATGTVKIDTETHDETVRDITLAMDTVYALFKQLRRMDIFSDRTDEDLLGIAVRYIIYHELTHSLQAAYANFHGRLVGTRLGASFVHGGKLGNETAPKRYSKYGLEGVDEVLESEKQAEGVALHFTLLDLDFPPDQSMQTEKQIRDIWAAPAIGGLLRLSSRVRKHFTHKKGNPELDVVVITRALAEAFHSPAVLSVMNKGLSGALGALRGYAFPHRQEILVKQVYQPLTLPPKNSSPLRDKK